MDTIEIREFRAGDECALYGIFYSAVHQLASANYTIEQLNAWAPPNPDLDAWYGRVIRNKPFVAVGGGQIVGFADLQDNGYIGQFFVSAQHPRRGIGALLMKRIHQVAAIKGMIELTSDVSRTAEPFYLHCGFEVVERKWPVRGEVALPNAFMRKRLSVNLLHDTDCSSSGRPT